MTYIFQDSLSKDILSVFNAKNGDLHDSEIKEGSEIDISNFTQSGKKEIVNIISISTPKEGFHDDVIIVHVKPSSYKGINPENSIFETQKGKGFVYKLEDIVLDRKSNPSEASFTASLLYKGINLIGSTLINQATETILEAKDGKKQNMSERAADLLYHYVILLAFYDVRIADIEEILLKRHKTLHGTNN